MFDFQGLWGKSVSAYEKKLGEPIQVVRDMDGQKYHFKVPGEFANKYARIVLTTNRISTNPTRVATISLVFQKSYRGTYRDVLSTLGIDAAMAKIVNDWHSPNGKSFWIAGLRAGSLIGGGENANPDAKGDFFAFMATEPEPRAYLTISERDSGIRK